MTATPQSHPFVGRADELADLTARTVDSGGSSITLLGGDAGVGKTRLLTELGARAQASGARVLLGHFLDLGDSSAPYLPLSEMFGRLAREDHDLARQLVAQRPLLGTVLPEFYRRDLPADLPTDRGSFFDAVHMVLEELAETEPLLVIWEDAHWADRSTRELLTFLFTRGFTGPVSMLVSYRSDDLHRRHPLRPKLAEWGRLAGVRRMVLDGLSDAAVLTLLRALHPDESEADLSVIISRASGNPFFAEELAAALDAGSLPDELADLLLVRLDSLTDSARSVIRAASVAGRSVDHDLLATVVDLPAAEFDRALRAAVDGNLVEVSPEGRYVFRHALLAEAVFDDLLPGERVQLHGRYAEALRDRTGPGAAAALARHARGAGLRDLSLRASLRAGEEAMAAAGPADAARHFEDALTTLAEGQAEGGGTSDDLPDRKDLMVKLSSALVAAGDPHRAAQLLDELRRGYTGPLAERAALVHELVRAQWLADLPEINRDLLEETIAELEQDGQSPLLVRLYALLGRVRLEAGDLDRAMLAASRAEVLARDLDLPEVLTDAMTTVARLNGFGGDLEGAEASLRQVLQRARDTGDATAEMRAWHQLARLRARMDRPREAYQSHLEGFRRAVATGQQTYPISIENRAMGAMYALLVGDPGQADELLDAGTETLPPPTEALLLAVRMVRGAARGDADVLDNLPRVRPFWGRDMFVCVHSSTAAIDVLGRRGELEQMLTLHDEVVDVFATAWNLEHFDARIHLSALVIGHLATAAVAGSDRDDRARIDALLSAAERSRGSRPDEALGSESQAWLVRARAEAERFEWAGEGRPSAKLIDHWQAVVNLYESAQIPYEQARSRLRLAELLAASGEREQARALSDQVAGTARELGASDLLTEASPTAGGRGGTGTTTLTRRESEVLDLVAQGRSNAEIAAALFISAKTVSVHVSNIMAKVGASSRTEAVAKLRGTG